jgi:hypothetical protein
MQLSRLYNKRVQNEADGNPESVSSGVESPAVADEAGLLGSISCRSMCSTNPAVRNQRENVCPQIPPKHKLAPEVCDVDGVTGRPPARYGAIWKRARERPIG